LASIWEKDEQLIFLSGGAGQTLTHVLSSLSSLAGGFGEQSALAQSISARLRS